MLGHLLNSTLNKQIIVQITAVVQTKKYDDDGKPVKFSPKLFIRENVVQK
jgi:hypothetical protein